MDLETYGVSIFSRAIDLGSFDSYNASSVTKHSPKSFVLLYLCKAIPQEVCIWFRNVSVWKDVAHTAKVLSKNLNKYGTKEELAEFNQWLRVYGKADILMLGAYSPNLVLCSWSSFPLSYTSGKEVVLEEESNSSGARYSWCVCYHNPPSNTLLSHIC